MASSEPPAVPPREPDQWRREALQARADLARSLSIAAGWRTSAAVGRDRLVGEVPDARRRFAAAVPGFPPEVPDYDAPPPRAPG